jgi:hypothetical protein
MDIIIGIGLLIYFIGLWVYTAYSGGDFSELRTILQLSVSGIGSMIILLPILWGRIKNLSLPSIPNIIPDIIPDKEEQMDLPECGDKIKMDTECLHYLKHRAAEIGSDEAMQMVIKLNTLLFADVCKEEKQDENKS